MTRPNVPFFPAAVSRKLCCPFATTASLEMVQGLNPHRRRFQGVSFRPRPSPPSPVLRLANWTCTLQVDRCDNLLSRPSSSEQEFSGLGVQAHQDGVLCACVFFPFTTLPLRTRAERRLVVTNHNPPSLLPSATRRWNHPLLYTPPTNTGFEFPEPFLSTSLSHESKH